MDENKINKKLEWMATQIIELKNRTDLAITDIRSEIRSIKDTLKHISKRDKLLEFFGIGMDSEKLKEIIRNSNQWLVDIEKRLDELENRIDTVENDMSDAIDDLESDISDLNDRLDGLEDRIDDVEADIDASIDTIVERVVNILNP